MSDYERLRMELRTELELMAMRQGVQAQVVEGISDRIAEQGQRIAEQSQRIAEQGQEIQRHAHETERLGREFAESSRWMQGRFRLLQERFDTILSAVVQDALNDRTLIHDLDRRVTRLEGDRPPAA